MINWLTSVTRNTDKKWGECLQKSSIYAMRWTIHIWDRNKCSEQYKVTQNEHMVQWHQSLAQWLGARLYFPTECSASILFSLFLPILLATGVWDRIYLNSLYFFPQSSTFYWGLLRYLQSVRYSCSFRGSSGKNIFQVS